jgi:hypothetical protein
VFARAVLALHSLADVSHWMSLRKSFVLCGHDIDSGLMIDSSMPELAIAQVTSVNVDIYKFIDKIDATLASDF